NSLKVKRKEKNMKKIFILLLLAANICFAQAIIYGDPTEPYGPIRPDYWIGRKDTRLTPPSPSPRGEGKEPALSTAKYNASEVEGSFTVAQTDSYTFGTNVRVNDDTPGWFFATPYSSGGHAMAARGDTVYLVWRDDRSGTSAIFFDKSFDSGTTWGTDVAISDNPAAAAVMPALALGKDGTIYVSWTDFRDGNRHIYFAKSTNGGTSFGPSVRVQTATEDKQEFSSIAVNDSGYIFIAYKDFRNLATTAIDIYCSRSINGGSNFETAVRVDDCADSVDQWEPCIAVKDSSIYLAWTDFRDTVSYSNVYYTISNNSGIGFNNNFIINDTVGLPKHAAARPSISINDSGLIYLSWGDTRNDGGISDIYFTKSVDGGQTILTPNINLIDAAGSSFYQGYPSLACDDSGGVYCAWEDHRNGMAYPWLIYFNYSKNYGDSFATNNIHVDDRSLSEDVQLYTPTICANKAGKVFCAWDENRDNPGGISTDIYATAGLLDGVEGKPEEVPGVSAIRLKAYPNPFKNMATIEYQIPNKSNISLSIYNINGQLVKIMVAGYEKAGKYIVVWNGRDNEGNKVCCGIYVICLKANNAVNINKITIIK
ncbi:MAG: FlgD immunoglobulin-like domain containing protein, partial [Saprospiraceae bacterium]|nr:FlgD immunoglobulin-like domain containing protein [Saprospiraceae bacterium]